MKKIFSFALIASAMVAGFSSCSNDDEVPGASQSAELTRTIGFDVKGNLANATRGFATTTANAPTAIPNFQTWAYDDTTDGLYMGSSTTEGKIVAGDGAGNWSYSPTQFWPVNPLNFVAIAPADPNGVSANTTASKGNIVTLNTTLTLSANVEDQSDIMYAEADNIEKADHTGNVPFTFKHALSQIVFKGKFNNEGAVTKATIAEISLCNVKNTATLVFNSNGQFYGGDTKPAISDGAATFMLDADDLEGSVWEASTQGTDAFDLTVSNNSTKKNAWMMIPQSVAAWDGTTVDALGVPNDGGAYIKLRVKLEKDGVVIKDNADTDALYLPLNINWDRTKKYIYTIEFNGTNALNPITCSVEAEDWEEVNITDIPKDDATTISVPSKVL